MDYDVVKHLFQANSFQHTHKQTHPDENQCKIEQMLNENDLHMFKNNGKRIVWPILFLYEKQRHGRTIEMVTHHSRRVAKYVV